MITVELPGIAPLINDVSEEAPYLANLTGWHDSSSTSWEHEQVRNGIGSYDDSYPEEAERRISVAGQYDVPGGDVWALRRQIMGLKFRDEEFPMTVTDGDGTALTAMVKVSGIIEFQIFDEGGYADFVIPLVAIDPRKYHPVQALETGLPTPGGGLEEPFVEPVSDGMQGDPGRIVLTNTGTAPSTPILRVSGGLSEGVELIAIEKGLRIRLERLIPEGSVVTFDMDRGQAWMDEASPIGGYLTYDEWWTVAPGETVTLQFSGLGTVTGTPKLTAEFSPAEA